MNRRTIAWAALLLLMASGRSFGQGAAPQHQSSKYRTLFTIGGGGGGFALGTFAGLAAFEDSSYASRKIWTTALISAAGGAVGGYFLGRALDKRAARKGGPPVLRKRPDMLDLSLARAKWPLDGPFAAHCLPKAADQPPALRLCVAEPPSPFSGTPPRR